MIKQYGHFVNFRGGERVEWHSFAEGGILSTGRESALEQAKTRNRKIRITQVAIAKVPRVAVPGFSEEQNTFFQSAHQAVLRAAQTENDSDEVALAYNLYTCEEVMVLGDAAHVDLEGNISFRVLQSNAYARELVILHNHPTTATFSLADIDYFIANDYIGTMSVVTNQGEIYVLHKTDRYAYDRIKAIEMDLVRQYTLEEQRWIVRDFLTKCWEGGVAYVRGK